MKTKKSKSVYTIAQLAEAAGVFGSNPVLVKAALVTAGQETYTEEDARKVIEMFIQKEVK